jgi:hypothetical protein
MACVKNGDGNRAALTVFFERLNQSMKSGIIRNKVEIIETEKQYNSLF